MARNKLPELSSTAVRVTASCALLANSGVAQNDPPERADETLARDAAAQVAGGESAARADWFHIGGQATFIGQFLDPFHSPYSGPHSFRSEHEGRVSQTYTLYLGARPFESLEAFVDPEMARGQGLSDALGLAGFTNGEVIRNPDLGQDPYLARGFVRWTTPTGGVLEQVEPGDHSVPGLRPTERIVVSAGKLSTADIFDLNSYANNTRTQFMNWALLNDPAYDYAADTRGYTRGIALEWITPDLALRAGSFQMPTVANGPELDGDLSHARGDQVEGELHAQLLGADEQPLVARLLAFRNMARAGTYSTAIEQGAAGGTAPVIESTRERGTVKYGFGLNLEQPLADEGATGMFARLGWNDGRTETFAYTEVDRHVSLGAQVGGARWSRADDRVGIALAMNWLSPTHRQYLENGGLGFVLGDGRLNYAPETILESYYAYQFRPGVVASLDGQFIQDPGYNSDRGPVTVLSLRLHCFF